MWRAAGCGESHEERPGVPRNTGRGCQKSPWRGLGSRERHLEGSGPSERLVEVSGLVGRLGEGSGVEGKTKGELWVH